MHHTVGEYTVEKGYNGLESQSVASGLGLVGAGMRAES